MSKTLDKAIRAFDADKVNEEARDQAIKFYNKAAKAAQDFKAYAQMAQQWAQGCGVPKIESTVESLYRQSRGITL